MPAGDAHRIWFPEIVETLRTRWHDGLSFDRLIELRDNLDTTLQRIRSERHIRPPAFKCPRCGRVGEGAEPHVSVRAMILSLARFGIAAAEQANTLEKSWTAYRKQNGLDVYGKPPEPALTHITRCAHPQVR